MSYLGSWLTSRKLCTLEKGNCLVLFSGMCMFTYIYFFIYLFVYLLFKFIFIFIDLFFPKPYRESTVRQLQDTALAQQKGGLPSADALELSLQTCSIDKMILYRGFFIRYSAKRLFPHKLLCMVYPSLPGLPNSLFAILDSSGTAGHKRYLS